MGKNQTKEQKKKDDLFKAVLRERLAYKSKEKIKYIEPIIEPSNIERLMENMENSKNFTDLRSIEYLRIPPQNPKEFNSWKFFHDTFWFERNLDIWRQFHITIKCDLILFVVDGREPEFFFENDIYKFVDKEKLIVFVNKSDLMDSATRSKCENYFHKVIFYSAKSDGKICNNDFTNNELTEFIINSNYKTVGLIGYPNVGKSSIINSILQTKKAKISSTPGKTKFAQSLILGGKKLLDCPGLVFPRHTKEDLVLRGILNVDQTNFKESFEFIIEKVGVFQILEFFKCKNFVNDSRNELIENFFLCFKTRGWDRGQIIKKVVKAYFEGKLKMCPSIKPIEKNYDWATKETKCQMSKKRGVFHVRN
ncbi:GTPase LSG1-1 [Cucumispora dikerogammari]|nr:GTPase LSG1-1 [Cucumispora dikerogammari]